MLFSGDILLFQSLWLRQFCSPLFGFFWFVPGFVEPDLVATSWKLCFRLVQPAEGISDDISLRTVLESLLQSHEKAGEFPKGHLQVGAGRSLNQPLAGSQ